jgi:hypothetical protein
MQLIVQLRALRGRLLVALTALAVIISFGMPAGAAANPSSTPSAATSVTSVSNASSASDTLVAQAAPQITAVATSAITAANAVALTTATSSMCSITKGVGGLIYYDWVGMYMCAGIALLCPDPMKDTAAPARIVDTTTVYYPNSSSTKLTLLEVAQLNDLLDKFATPLNAGGALYGKSSASVNGVTYAIADYGRALRLAGWKFSHQTARLTRDLPRASAKVQALYNYMIAFAVANAGQYKLTKLSQQNPGLNATGTATYKVTSVTTGKAIKGVSVKVAVPTGNATATSTVSDAYGVIKVSFKRTKYSNIHLTLTGVGPSYKVRYYVPQLSVWQRFFSAAPRLPFSAALDSNVAPKVVTIDYKCTGCVTAAPVTPTAPICNTYNGAETRAYLEDNGVVRSDYTVIAAGTCATPTWKVADTHKVRVRVSVLVGAWVHYYSDYKIVDCKPAPELAFASSTKCTGRVVDINVPADATHTIGLEINGSLVTSPAGMPLSYHKAAPCTESLSFAIRAGITSHNGTQWNMTPLETHSFTAKSVS